eukprot:11165370-Lingulodinium_polyedra.AAC.1
MACTSKLPFKAAITAALSELLSRERANSSQPRSCAKGMAPGSMPKSTSSGSRKRYCARKASHSASTATPAS